jgi:hypothetical protein
LQASVAKVRDLNIRTDQSHLSILTFSIIVIGDWLIGDWGLVDWGLGIGYHGFFLKI